MFFSNINKINIAIYPQLSRAVKEGIYIAQNPAKKINRDSVWDLLPAGLEPATSALPTLACSRNISTKL
jgi:hypothetical protein